MVKETRVQRKKRKLRFYRNILLILILIGLIIFWSLRTRFLQIREISIEGNNRIPMEDIIEKSGIELGDNIIRTSSGKVREKIMDLPYSEDIRVRKKLPGTVEIEVKEREPYLQFQYNYSYGVIDREGIVLEYTIRKNSDIPDVKGLQWNHVNPGESILETPLGIEIADILGDDQVAEIVLKIREVGYEDKDNIKFNLFNGMTVEFGPLHNVKYKLRVLDEIVQDLEEKNIPTRLIIMNKGEHPIVVRDEK